MSKLTVESIIRIYGSSVKEIKAYNEARRAKVEDFLQIEPVAFALSDEPDVLRIYIDKKSACASLDGTLEEVESQEDTSKERKEMTVKGLPKYREVKSIDFESVREKCIEKRWYTRGTTEEYTALADYIFNLKEVATENLVAIGSDILEHSETDYDIEAILWELNRACNTYFVHE